MNEITNNFVYVKCEMYLNYIFCKLCKNGIYVTNVNYVKYG